MVEWELVTEDNGEQWWRGRSSFGVLLAKRQVGPVDQEADIVRPHRECTIEALARPGEVTTLEVLHGQTMQQEGIRAGQIKGPFKHPRRRRFVAAGDAGGGQIVM